MGERKGWGIVPLVENLTKIEKWGRWDRSECCWKLSEHVGAPKVKIGAIAHEMQCSMELCQHMW